MMIDDETARRLREAIHANQGVAMLAPSPAWASSPDFPEPTREPKPTRQFCSKGHKFRFETEAAALTRLAEIQDEPPQQQREYMPTSVRSCRICGGFHLTSKPQKPYAHGKSLRRTRITRRPR